MSESKHTPGPWNFRAVYSIDRLPATALLLETSAPDQPMNDPCVLAVREDWIGWLLRTPKGQANAHLIAAAPDLLAACKESLHFLDVLNDGYSTDQVSPQEVNLAEQLRAAIAKAEGGEA